MTHEEQRAALLRERENRLNAYLASVAARDAIAPFANGPDALEFDRRELVRAESRVNSAINAMRMWNDPIPAAPAATTITAPAAPAAPSERSGAVSHPLSEADRLANEIIAAANAAILPGAKTEADKLADEIVAAAAHVSAELAGPYRDPAPCSPDL
jgi:hypothetical protein